MRPAVAIATSRYVTIALAAIVTGYTEDAIETKIKRGVWVEGVHYRIAPDGRRMIDVRGVEQWVEGQNLAESLSSAAR